jgi:tetratricopeptide (TPR) repeat protein
MVIRRPPPSHPRRGPSCMLVLLVILAMAGAAVLVANAEEVRDTFITPPTPEPTRSPASYATSGALLSADGEYEDAISAYEQAIALDSSQVGYYPPVIGLYTLIGNPAAALELEDAALALDENNKELLVALAAAHLAYGDRLAETGDPTGSGVEYEEAAQLARQATELDPNDAEAYAYLAGALASQGPDRLAQAQEAAQIAVELDAGNPIVHRYMATVLEVQGLYDSAIEQYTIALEQNPPLPAEIYIGLAYNQYAVGNIQGAILTFQDALDVDPENPDAFEGLGYMYFLIGEYSLAQENLQRAVDLDPAMVRGHAHLGAALFRQNFYPAAIAELTLAVEEYETVTFTNAPYFVMLGLSHYRNDENCQEAEPLFEAVLAVVADEENAIEGLELCHAVELQSP